MWLNLSKSEVLALERICISRLSPGQLAESLGKKGSFVSRVLRKLEEKGLVTREGREIRLSPASHAQKFKNLFDSRPNAKIEEWLCGNAMDVLIVIGGGEGADFNLLMEEAGCSKPTIYKVLKSLYSAGVAGKEGKTIRITDRFLAGFVEEYANNLQNVLLSEARGSNVSIRVRKRVVVRTDAPQVPAFFSKTGINALVEKGLEANRTSYSDYYFNLDKIKR
ncbi:MAG: MarR family transcriptional regulator, partial [Candidatus Micrarchaeota archaeon]|nr:MarR family transcriptional regulator [Candidatus Micrarchaeota archaeon]